MLGVFRGQIASTEIRMIDLEVEIRQKRQNKVFRVKQSSNKVSPLFLDAKPLQERCEQRLYTPESNTKGTAHVFRTLKGQNQP